MRPVAIVQHEPSVPPGHVGAALRSSDVDHFVVEAWQEPEWPAAIDLAGLVVLGGTMNADQLDGYPFLRRSRALLEDALEREVPTLGICLGSQMMSRVLGGEVFRAPARNAFFAGLEVPPEAADDPVVAPFAGGTPVLQFHEDTFTLPDGAIALARSSSSGLLQAFRYGPCAYAVQFHFEVDAAILAGWCRNIGVEAMAEEWGTPASDLLAQGARYLDAQREAGEALMAGFLGLTRNGGSDGSRRPSEASVASRRRA
jgi:GMP synthase (glutamine-hydrolysing)